MNEQLQHGAMEMTHNPEIKEAYNYVYLGRLGDLGLGSEGGIKSPLETDEQVHEYAQKYAQCLAASSADPSRVACIDGRVGEGFEDGSAYQPLDRAAGGTFADYVMAKASRADITKVVVGESLLDETDEIESAVGQQVGTAGKCSHGKGCGACNRAVEHMQVAAGSPVMSATEALMNQPDINRLTGISFNAEIAEEVSDGFRELAQELENRSWDGAAYTNRAVEQNPRGVERLAGESTQPHHGHKEAAIEIVVDANAVPDERLMKELGLEDGFGLTLGRMGRVANTLAGQKGARGMTAALTAGVAWNVAVGSNLCHPNMPIVLVIKS